MPVLWGIVLADDKVGSSGDEIVLVLATELVNFVAYSGLVERRKGQLQESGVEPKWEARRAYKLIRGDACTAHHDALEGLGRVE